MNFIKKVLLGVTVGIIGAIAFLQPAAAVTITVSAMEYANATHATIHWPLLHADVQAGGFQASNGNKSFPAWCVDTL